ncbi:MAG TPA: hypothetical protein VGG91_20230 [Myxococcaceae bacterium]|jgi:hypothetical protein
MKRWLVLGLIACACGSSDGGSPDAGGNPNPGGSLTGTVGGHPLDVKEAVFGIDPMTRLVWVYAADRTGVCALLGGTSLPGTTTALALVMVNVTGTSTGDYTTGNYAWIDLANVSGLPPPGLYWAGSFAVATSCTASTTGDATAGTVSVTQVGNSTGTHLKLNVTNVKFGTDTLNGSLEASYCTTAAAPTCGGGGTP